MKNQKAFPRKRKHKIWKKCNGNYFSRYFLHKNCQKKEKRKYRDKVATISFNNKKLLLTYNVNAIGQWLVSKKKLFYPGNLFFSIMAFHSMLSACFLPSEENPFCASIYELGRGRLAEKK